MDMNRNKLFTIGLVVLALGIQLRLVHTFILNEKASKFVAEKLDSPAPPANNGMPTFIMASANQPVAKRPVQPPTWLGWSLMSVGFVVVCHAMAMKKAG